MFFRTGTSCLLVGSMLRFGVAKTLSKASVVCTQSTITCSPAVLLLLLLLCAGVGLVQQHLTQGAHVSHTSNMIAREGVAIACQSIELVACGSCSMWLCRSSQQCYTAVPKC
jgi:hypothetical protein